MTVRASTRFITADELARLFEDAFAKWQDAAEGDDARRDTPRIPVDGASPLFVVSYTVRDVPLNCAATITDVSADGLGIVLAKPVPVGATVRIAIENKRGRRAFGLVEVASLIKCDEGYRVGLRFRDAAAAIDERSR